MTLEEAVALYAQLVIFCVMSNKVTIAGSCMYEYMVTVHVHSVQVLHDCCAIRTGEIHGVFLQIYKCIHMADFPRPAWSHIQSNVIKVKTLKKRCKLKHLQNVTITINHCNLLKPFIQHLVT